MATLEPRRQLVDELERCVRRTFYVSEDSVFEVARDESSPSKIDGSAPDLYFKSDYNEVIGAVETLEGLESGHADAQLMAFMKRAQSSHAILFLLAVPVGALSEARSKLDRIDPNWHLYAWILPFQLDR